MNILAINLKGGAAKTTNSSIVASYLPEATLIEIDKINKSDDGIKSKDYRSVQLDFMNESDSNFIEFETMLLDENTKIIDVGAVKLETFHKAMVSSNLYDTIDLFIITAMDGKDDADVALTYLNSVKNEIDMNKVIFAFNRFNDHEYSNVKEQFDNWFEKTEQIKKAFNIDLKNEDTYYVIKDSRAIKQARKMGITYKSLVDEDLDKITKEQRACKDKAERLKLTEYRSLVNNAQNLFNDYISIMLEKIQKKLG
uniref:hypothetical protein n=1 Tax=Aliarcobacter sp. TaxID=2321116 RepID=UPI004047A680